MLNPSLSNFQIQLSDDFFPKDLTEKYEGYLKQMNSPFIDFEGNFMETVKNISIPGLTIPVLNIQELQNLGIDPYAESFNPQGFPHPTINRSYEGNEPWNNVIETTVATMTLRNNLINWMYCYEFMYKRYRRENRTNQFQIILIMKDSAEIPMIKFVMSDCFISNMPGLEFTCGESFNESKTIDVGITFNKLDVEFNIPNFKTISVNLKQKQNVNN